MLSAVTKKIQQHGIIWCVKRAMREFWHPRFPWLQKLGAVNHLIYWPFGQLGKTLDFAESLGATDTKDTLYLFYDLEVSPITYDFSWALAISELQRQQLNLKYIHIVIVPGNNNNLRKEDAQYESVINQAARHWRITNMLIPMINLLPHANGFTCCLNRQQAAYIQAKAKHVTPKMYSANIPITNTFNRELKAGLDLRCLQATPQALAHVDDWITKFAAGRKLISITIRQYDYMPARNSNLEEWDKFARSLDPKVYAIVIMPDISQAWTDGPAPLTIGYNFAPATWNLALRAAMYERCYINLGINCGPIGLCWLSKTCNYITFKMQTTDVGQTTDTFMQWLGFTIGASLPFASPNQKWVWEADDYPIIEREFNLMCRQLECQKI